MESRIGDATEANSEEEGLQLWRRAEGNEKVVAIYR